MTCTLGLIPERFKGLQGLELYFALARGHKDAPALDMSKYFNTNYHYLVRATDCFDTLKILQALLPVRLRSLVCMIATCVEGN
jgi:hypothetical protein